MRFEHVGRFDGQPAERLLSKLRELPCPRTIQFGGVDLEIRENVFSPDVTNTSALMLASLERYTLRPGGRFLDLFTGSGVFAIRGAKLGCHAIAVDTEAGAIECTRRSASLNGASHLVDVRQGDGLSCLHPADVFDFVTACPPLLPGSPSDALEAAIVDPGLTATLRVIRGLHAHLAAGAPALILLSDVFERIGYDIHELARQANLSVRCVLARTLPYETYTVYEFTRV